MRLLLFSDLHLDAAFSWAGTGARRRREALRKTLRRIAQLAIDQRVDALLCGGDLYEDEHVTADTRAFLAATFAQVPCPIYIAPGNHDWLGPRSAYTQVPWSQNVHVFTANRLTPVTLVEGLTLWGAAHCAPANTPGFLEDFRVDRGGVHIALFHGSEQGSFQRELKQAPHAPFRAEQIRESGLHFAFLGHFHQPHDAAAHIYPGNPEPLGFGEEGLRAAVLATITLEGEVKCERHHVAVSDLHDVAVDVTGCTTRQEVRDRIEAAVTNLQGLARVTLNGELAPDVDFRGVDFSDLACALDEPPFIRWNIFRVGYDLDSIACEATVRGEFVRQVYAADLPEDERQRVLITGLRALDGRDDLEVFGRCNLSR